MSNDTRKRRDGGRARAPRVRRCRSCRGVTCAIPTAPRRAVGGSARGHPSHVAANPRRTGHRTDVATRARDHAGLGAETDEVTAPSGSTTRARTRARDAPLEFHADAPQSRASRHARRRSLVFGLVAGPPNVHDCVRGRRPGNYRDYCDFIRLAQHFNAMHLIGNQVCAPIELPAARATSTPTSPISCIRTASIIAPPSARPGARRHRDDGDRPRYHAGDMAGSPGRHHDHLGQQPAAVR